MNGEISVADLATETGYTAANIAQLVKRGYLPPGRKEGIVRYLPYVESKLILAAHKPGQHWVSNRPRPGKRKNGLATTNSPSDISWDDVL